MLREAEFLTDELKALINNVLEYSWGSELDDYVQEGCPEGHIFESLVHLDRRSFGHSKTPFNYMGERHFETLKGFDDYPTLEEDVRGRFED